MGDSRLTESQFHMWRTLVALSHVDGSACEAERSFIRESLSKLKAAPEQIGTIEADLGTVHKPEEFFNGISDAKDRAWLFYLARLMFFKDANFCDYEKMAYDKLHVRHMEKVNLPEVLKQIEKIEKDILAEEPAPPTRGTGLFRRFLTAFMKRS